MGIILPQSRLRIVSIFFSIIPKVTTLNSSFHCLFHYPNITPLKPHYNPNISSKYSLCQDKRMLQADPEMKEAEVKGTWAKTLGFRV